MNSSKKPAIFKKKRKIEEISGGSSEEYEFLSGVQSKKKRKTNEEGKLDRLSWFQSLN